MTLEATANSWVELEADGKTILNTEVVTGEKREFEATDQFRFRTVGNAAGLTLTLNGARVGPLGATGEVVKNRIFDRAALSELRASPESTSRNLP